MRERLTSLKDLVVKVWFALVCLSSTRQLGLCSERLEIAPIVRA